MHLNRRHILILFLILLIVSIFIPFPVRYNFIAIAKVYPLKEWKLSQGSDEGFYSQTYDYRSDAVSDLKHYRFERGDIAELKVKKTLRFDTIIGENDTVARIESFYIQNEIIHLNNQREVELANKKVLATGEKQSLVDEAQRKYSYAMEQLELQKKNFARQQMLYLDSVIPAAEYDIHENSLKLAEINTQVAHNELLSLLSGVKDPVLEMSDRQISSYENEIDRLEAQKAQYTITNPFAGLLTYDASLGGILKVSDNRGLVLRMPVPYQQASYLNNLHSVTFSTLDNKITLKATFIGFEEKVSLIHNEQFIIAKAITEGSTIGIYPGMVVRCSISCDKVPLLEYLKRNFAVSLF